MCSLLILRHIFLGPSPNALPPNLSLTCLPRRPFALYSFPSASGSNLSSLKWKHLTFGKSCFLLMNTQQLPIHYRHEKNGKSVSAALGRQKKAFASHMRRGTTMTRELKRLSVALQNWRGRGLNVTSGCCFRTSVTSQFTAAEELPKI